MTDILDDLVDLKKQATTERSHFYVAGCCDRAITEIRVLRAAIDVAKTGLLRVERQTEEVRAAITATIT